MSRIAFILGDSGSGKSTSLRNLTKNEVNVVSVTGKELPLKTDIAVYHPKSYEDVIRAVTSADKPIVVIDDANYLMSNFEFSTINEVGYGKFSRNALGMVNVFNSIINKDSDQIFYIMAHTEQSDDGKLRFKTTGKMVSEKYNPSGITNIVLEASYDDQTDSFVFRTKADGRGIKSPLGMFSEDTIDNDLKLVDKTIREFYS
jgi:energy-coupling factor transporter ATP-binding protein EcfA2